MLQRQIWPPCLGRCGGALSPEEAERCQVEIERLAESIDALAESIGEGAAGYWQFEQELAKLHRLGFFPPIDLFSSVVNVFVGRPEPGR
jgi:hypothetical protein